MKILYYDCFSGISGDMHLGAMIDIGVDFEYLKKELNKLCIKDEFELVYKKSSKNSISGIKIDVIIKEKQNCPRSFKDIEKIINESKLSQNIKDKSIEIFYTLAVVEGKIHNISPQDIHFHEIGAIDSIVDIIGSVICIDFLKVDKIYSSKIELGGGFIKCDHGNLPVPAPATIELLKNIPISLGLTKSEMTTPTGAVIISTFVDEFVDKCDFIVEKIGYGFGNSEFEFPNALRLFLGHEAIPDDKEILLETNIDDMNPEVLSYVEEKLYEAGAIDVFKTSILTKKNRLGIKLSILAKAWQEEKITDIIFSQTSTLGLRKHVIEKISLMREFKNIKTKFGEIGVKFSYLHGKLIKHKAEYEDCKKLAIINNVPILEIYQALENEINCKKNLNA